MFTVFLFHYVIKTTYLYASESWTSTAELQRRIQAMEMRCYCKIPHISYKDHVTNEEVCAKIQKATGPLKDHLTIVKTQTAEVRSCLRFIRSGTKKITQREEEVGRQHQGMDRPGVRQVPEGSGEQGKIEETGCEIICGAPTTVAVKG